MDELEKAEMFSTQLRLKTICFALEHIETGERLCSGELEALCWGGYLLQEMIQEEADPTPLPQEFKDTFMQGSHYAPQFYRALKEYQKKHPAITLPDFSDRSTYQRFKEFMLDQKKDALSEDDFRLVRYVFTHLHAFAAEDTKI